MADAVSKTEDIAELQRGLRYIYNRLQDSCEERKLNHAAVMQVLDLKTDKAELHEVETALREDISVIKRRMDRQYEDFLGLRPVVERTVADVAELRGVLYGTQDRQSMLAYIATMSRALREHQGMLHTIALEREKEAKRADIISLLGEFFMDQGPLVLPLLGVIVAVVRGVLEYLNNIPIDVLVYSTLGYLAVPGLLGLSILSFRKKRGYHNGSE